MKRAGGEFSYVESIVYWSQQKAAASIFFVEVDDAALQKKGKTEWRYIMHEISSTYI